MKNTDTTNRQREGETLSLPLITWYQLNKRDLPWRKDRDPYHVWVSEIMLQQTRVAAVIPYYERFMSILPNIEALASCPEDVLLKLWEGLGYYSRARNLKKAAQIIVEKYGAFPCSYEEILSLPGIGPYTAGAIASICFDIPKVAADGNVFRIMSRLYAYDGDIAGNGAKEYLSALAGDAMPSNAPSMYTQALMELGQVVCTPSGTPFCDKCPWQERCKAHANGREQEYPVKSPSKKRSIEQYTVLLIMDGKKVALHKRAKDGLLAGMYEFPLLENNLSCSEVLEKVQDMGYNCIRILELPWAKHIFSHKEWHMCGYQILLDELGEKPKRADYVFADIESVAEKYPIPSAFRAYTKYLSLKQGREHFKKA